MLPIPLMRRPLSRASSQCELNPPLVSAVSPQTPKVALVRIAVFHENDFRKDSCLFGFPDWPSPC